VRLPTPARRTLLAAAIAVAAPVVGFLLIRPAIERAARTRFEREARALGLSATIGAVRLTPWLSFELGDVVVENPGRVRVLSRSVVVGPHLSPLGLVGRAAHVATTRVLADLPGGVRLDLAPADWVVESRWRNRRIALLSRGEALEITVARDSGALRVEARAAAARLSQRLRVLLHGCPVASLGTVDGGAQVERSATGDWQRTLKAVFRLSGIPDGHAHRFRDTFAVELLQEHVPMDRVSVLLGHSSIKVTEKHYSPWVRARQEQLEADVRRAWEAIPLLSGQTKGTPEVHEKAERVN